jgi:hypothetical protein
MGEHKEQQADFGGTADDLFFQIIYECNPMSENFILGTIFGFKKFHSLSLR